MADSPAAGAPTEAPKKITFRFCRECANLLYPKEDKANNKLEFACRTCYYSEEAETTCIFRNELANTVGETAGITQDIGEDPTVGDADADPNADFYAHEYGGSGDFDFDLASDMEMDVDVDLELASRVVGMEGMHAIPELCTMCGQTIFCGFCGEESDRGLLLEVDADEAAHRLQQLSLDSGPLKQEKEGQEETAH